VNIVSIYGQARVFGPDQIASLIKKTGLEIKPLQYFSRRYVPLGPNRGQIDNVFTVERADPVAISRSGILKRDQLHFAI
jgi:hypothetical protein